MSNQYIYNNYQQYSPNMPHSSLSSNNGGGNNSNGGSINSNTSPTTANLNYISPPGSSNNSLLSSSTNSSTTTSGSSMVGGQPQPPQQQQHVVGSNYSFHTPRLRYYLSKSFDIEDDLEFCPEISESSYLNTSPTIKKFNPYTATVFSPSQEIHNLNLNQQQQQQQVHSHSHTPVFVPSSNSANSTGNPTSPRIHTPRIKKPLEIVNPQTKLRVGSPAIQNK